MKKTLFFGAAIAVLSIFSCRPDWGRVVWGNGDMIVEARTLSVFQRISSVGSLNIEVKFDSISRVVIEGESNLVEYINTDVSDKTLSIEIDPGIQLRPSRRLKLVVYTPDVRSFKIAGSSDIISAPLFRPDGNVVINISGSGSFTGDVTARDLYANISGSGKVNLKGSADYAEYRISGSGRIDALDCEAKEIYAQISGSGRINLYATDYLEAVISGSGAVRYKGNPIVVKQISGTGSLKRI